VVVPHRAAVEPMPPRAIGALPWVGAGLRLLAGPAAFFAETRDALGTYVVDAFGYRLLCVFSPAGVQALYGLPEDQASFGLATYHLLSLKLQPELFEGRRTTARTLFGGDDVERYLANLAEAVRLEIAERVDAGTFEVFTMMRRLGHRLGLASWIGPEAAAPPWLGRLMPLFDRLDSSDAFVRPARAFLIAATRHAGERRAMHAIERAIASIRLERVRRGGPSGLLDEVYAAYADLPESERHVRAARDVMMLHLGSQSNLHAALAWTLVNVVQRPALLARIRDGDDALLEQAASESIRLAQRSITLRLVLRSLDLALEDGSYRIAPGVLLTTMLSATNTSAAPGLDRFDPAHYDGRRLSPRVAVPARELVSTFGHGSHSCPAQRFAVTAIRIAVGRLITHYDLTPHFATAEPRRRQLGAVARAEAPCMVAYRLR
jgi:cytochrome P450